MEQIERIELLIEMLVSQLAIQEKRITILENKLNKERNANNQRQESDKRID